MLPGPRDRRRSLLRRIDRRLPPLPAPAGPPVFPQCAAAWTVIPFIHRSRLAALGPPFRVGVGGVDEVDARLEGLRHERVGLRLLHLTEQAEGPLARRAAAPDGAFFRVNTPSSATTWKCTKSPSVESNRCTNVTEPVSPPGVPRAVAFCFCQRAISSTKMRPAAVSASGRRASRRRTRDELRRRRRLEHDDQGRGVADRGDRGRQDEQGRLQVRHRVRRGQGHHREEHIKIESKQLGVVASGPVTLQGDKVEVKSSGKPHRRPAAWPSPPRSDRGPGRAGGCGPPRGGRPSIRSSRRSSTPSAARPCGNADYLSTGGRPSLRAGERAPKRPPGARSHLHRCRGMRVARLIHLDMRPSVR
jgi:hypothetical protein